MGRGAFRWGSMWGWVNGRIVSYSDRERVEGIGVLFVFCEMLVYVGWGGVAMGFEYHHVWFSQGVEEIDSSIS